MKDVYIMILHILLMWRTFFLSIFPVLPRFEKAAGRPGFHTREARKVPQRPTHRSTGSQTGSVGPLNKSINTTDYSRVLVHFRHLTMLTKTKRILSFYNNYGKQLSASLAVLLGCERIEKSQNSLKFGASWVEEKRKMGNGGGSGNRKHLVIQKR